ARHRGGGRVPPADRRGRRGEGGLSRCRDGRRAHMERACLLRGEGQGAHGEGARQAHTARFCFLPLSLWMLARLASVMVASKAKRLSRFCVSSKAQAVRDRWEKKD
ncbi:unnamed protein product, partial [Ectocarpus fasciculatus]